MIKFLEYFTEILAWLGIVISFTLLGAMLGFVLGYILLSGTWGQITGLGLTISGFITGIYLAIKAWKTVGTVAFISGFSQFRRPVDTNENSDK